MIIAFFSWYIINHCVAQLTCSFRINQCVSICTPTTLIFFTRFHLFVKLVLVTHLFLFFKDSYVYKAYDWWSGYWRWLFNLTCLTNHIEIRCIWFLSLFSYIFPNLLKLELLASGRKALVCSSNCKKIITTQYLFLVCTLFPEIYFRAHFMVFDSETFCENLGWN